MPAQPWAGVGVALPSIDAFGNGTPVREVARAAEQVGLDHVWVPDHLVFHRPILEATTTLSLVAGATERIGLGFGILNPTLRPVTWLAKQLATLAALVPNRVLMGVGLGGEYEAEFRAAGIDPRQRGKRLDEALALLPRLMNGELVEHSGLYEVACPGLAPVASVAPPVLVGGRAAAALRRAARFGDAWMPMWVDAEQIEESRGRLAAARRRAWAPRAGCGTRRVHQHLHRSGRRRGRGGGADQAPIRDAIRARLALGSGRPGRGDRGAAGRLSQRRGRWLLPLAASRRPLEQVERIAALRI